MNTLYEAVGSFRSLLFKEKSSQRHVIEIMDPLVRTALAEAVDEDTAANRSDWEQVSHELLHATAALESSVEKEKFIHCRYKHYERVLEEKSRALCNEQCQLKGDEEAAPVLQQRQEQLEKDKISLKAVKESHRSIIIQCEKMRRKVRDLEKKMGCVSRLHQQCQSFVDTAKECQQIQSETPDGSI